MIPIKIQCACGQRYAFDVEPVDGCMPYTVACPACGVDGTGAANAIIAQNMPTQPAVAAAPIAGIRLRTATPAPSAHPVALASTVPTAAPRGSMSHIPQIDRTQAEHEAKAKIMWGDTPEAVIQYLMLQGFGHEEASTLIEPMLRDRAATIRVKGIRKILIGAALASVPVITYLIFASIGVMSLKLLGMAIVVGVWGAWMMLGGTIMLLAPKSEPGDLADQ